MVIPSVTVERIASASSDVLVIQNQYPIAHIECHLHLYELRNRDCTHGSRQAAQFQPCGDCAHGERAEDALIVMERCWIIAISHRKLDGRGVGRI